jgi:hypothetical protein
MLAVEGDNHEGMKAMLRYPFFLDLDGKTVEASVSIAEQRLTHDPENTFYKGWLKIFLEKDARGGFEMMEVFFFVMTTFLRARLLPLATPLS